MADALMWIPSPLLAQVEDAGAPVVPDSGGAPAATEGQDAAPTGDPNAAPPPGGGFDSSFLMIMILLIVVMWVFLLGGNRKEKKRRAAMLAALTKGDKIQTVGGILGTVIEVREHEVIVKVDENANTRLRLARSAIQSVLEDKPTD